MVSYIIGFILVLIVLIIVGLFFRKTIYDQVDKLEAWKMDIMNRNVSGELQRVKVLRLSGEAQTMFERWKEKWDQILTRDMPDLEEHLFDAEEAADRFKITTAKKSLVTVEKILNDTEKSIENMFNELNDLLDSEKESKQIALELQPRIKELRNKLFHDLHAYGEAEKRFDSEIRHQKNQLDLFYQHTEEGNYYQARVLIEQIKAEFEALTERIDIFPAIYRRCRIELPDQITQLKNGIDQMNRDGYQIEHHNFNKELINMEELLKNYVDKMVETDDATVFEYVATVDERINEIYIILEDESKARVYVNKHLENFKTLISEAVDEFEETDEEVHNLQKTYYIEERDLELYANLQKWIHQLERQHQKISQDIETGELTYSSIKDELESSYQDLQKLKKSHEEFKEQIQMIRKDELEAKEKLDGLKKKLFEINRSLEKSNLPGIPSSTWNRIEEAEEKCTVVLAKLAEEPLDIGKVNRYLEDATASVESLIEKADRMIEQVYLIERIIQYSNRYRSQYPVLGLKLSEAEQMFREYKYDEALEVVSESLEEVEPGALQRLKMTVDASN